MGEEKLQHLFTSTAMAEVQEGKNTMELILICLHLETRQPQLLPERMKVPAVISSGQEEQVVNR